MKKLHSPQYNFVFDPKTGHFMRWGKTIHDNPLYSPIGPEILDIEVSTVCHGVNGPCKHCYKSNTPKGDHMSFKTFKTIFDKIPRTLTQVAFGVGDLCANQDLLDMLKYCRTNTYNPGVVPNITIHGGDLTDEWVSNLATYCGGVAVSVYEPKDVAYDAVKRLTDAGIQQVNLHMLVSEETYERCLMVIHDAKHDPRLAKLKAILFLTLKPKGVRNKLNAIASIAKYKAIVDAAQENNIVFGFDSCSAPLFLAAVKDSPNFSLYSNFAESCESNLFSAYINVDGMYWHCSFTEDHPLWRGISMLDVEDFLKDVWYNPEVEKFRTQLLTQPGYLQHDCRLCPVYNLYPKEIGDCSLKPDGSDVAIDLKGVSRKKIPIHPV